jgi:hypothetical protein
MLKHKGFPSRLPGTDFQFTIRRANKDGATKLVARERYADRRPADRRADAAFVEAIWLYFGEEPFERGNLDAGRLSWLFGREVIPAEDPFDPESYEALLRLDVGRAQAQPFPRPSTAGIWEGRGLMTVGMNSRAAPRSRRFGAKRPVRSIHRLYRSPGAWHADRVGPSPQLLPGPTATRRVTLPLQCGRAGNCPDRIFLPKPAAFGRRRGWRLGGPTVWM